MIKVYVDSDKKIRTFDPIVFKETFYHMVWCINNCKGKWYNEDNDYNYVCFANSSDAFEFAKMFAPFKNEQEEMWYKLKWL